MDSWWSSDSGMPLRNMVSVQSIIWLQPLPTERWRMGYKHITVPQCYNKINLNMPICPAKSPNKVLAALCLAGADQTVLSASKRDSSALSVLNFFWGRDFDFWWRNYVHWLWRKESGHVCWGHIWPLKCITDRTNKLKGLCNVMWYYKWLRRGGDIDCWWKPAPCPLFPPLGPTKPFCWCILLVVTLLPFYDLNCVVGRQFEIKTNALINTVYTWCSSYTLRSQFVTQVRKTLLCPWKYSLTSFIMGSAE